MLSVCSYLYYIVNIPYYRQEDNFLYYQYEMLKEWLNDEEDNEETPVYKCEFDQAEWIGDRMEKKIFNPANLTYFKERLNCFKCKDVLDLDCLKLAQGAFALLEQYPNENVFRNARPKEEAEDVLQEVFVKIWKNIDSYNTSKGRLYTWMLNIARNSSIDKLRSKNFNNSQKNLSADNFVHLLDDNAKTINKIDAIGIKEFIKKLKPKCIQLIDLLFFKGYTQQEASEELEIPLGTVKTQNRNCMNELRLMINE